MRLLIMMVALCATSAAPAQNAPTAQSPHPAIVRIVVPERDGTSYGSGALVAVNDTYGLVVTNWHVVRDAAAPVWVFFPDGFRSAATILKTDRDWDLAALAIWRPDVVPLPLATQPPQLGERLTIAGYGSGWFRAVSGQCTQYVSPGGNNPFEMIELSAPARNGDSGGPILNDRGEIAGVLFGSAFGQTTGSYCGRIRWFLSSVANDFQRLPAQPTAIAQQQPSNLVPIPLAAISAKPSSSPDSTRNASNSNQQQVNSAPTVNNQGSSLTSMAVSRDYPNFHVNENGTVSFAAPPTTYVPAEMSKGTASPFEPIRNFLAVIGIVAILMLGLRTVGKLAG